MKLNGRISSYRFRGKRKETSRANAEFRDSSIQIWKNRRFCFSDLPFFPFSSLFDMDFVLFLISTRAFNVILVGSFRFLSIRE